MNRRKVYAAACVSIFGACGERAHVENVDDVTHYHVSDIRTLAGVDDVRDALLDQHNTLWVIGRSSPYIHLYDSTGRLIKEGGVGGRGPSDFLFPSAFSPVADTTLVRPLILDIGRHELLTLNDQLSAISSKAARTVIGNMRADLIALVSQLPTAATVRADTVLIARVDRNAGTAHDLTAQSVVRTIGTQSTVLWNSPLDRSTNLPWLVGYPLWDACSDGSLVGVNASGTGLFRVHASGRVDTTTLSSFPRMPVSEADLVRLYMEHLEAEYRGQNRSVPPPEDLKRTAKQVVSTAGLRSTDSLPVFAKLSCLDQNTVLLKHYALKSSSSEEERWVRVRGGSLDTHLFPGGFEPLAYRGSSFVGLYYDSLQVASLATISPRR